MCIAFGPFFITVCQRGYYTVQSVQGSVTNSTEADQPLAIPAGVVVLPTTSVCALTDYNFTLNLI